MDVTAAPALGARHEAAELRIALQRLQHRGFALEVVIGSGTALAEVSRRPTSPQQQQIEPAVPNIVAALPNGGRDGPVVLQHDGVGPPDLTSQVGVDARRGQELAQLRAHG